MTNTATYRRVLWASALTGAVGVLLGCSDSGGGDDDDGGGGNLETGGFVPSTGGAGPASGGDSPVSTGGAIPGVTGGAVTGGEASLGGAPTGGADPVTGGVDPATGGVPPTTGGALPATGGDPGTGGEPTGGAGACDGGPLNTSVPNCEIEVPPATGDYHQDCVDVINAWRWQCHCLPPLERWSEAEACADQMAEYDYGVQSAHAGFRANVCEPGGRGQCECPGWGSSESITHPQESQWGGERESCLEMMWHEVDNPAGEQGHYEAMSSTSYTRVACGIYVAPDGEVWAVQNYDR